MPSEPHADSLLAFARFASAGNAAVRAFAWSTLLALWKECLAQPGFKNPSVAGRDEEIAAITQGLESGSYFYFYATHAIELMRAHPATRATAEHFLSLAAHDGLPARINQALDTRADAEIARREADGYYLRAEDAANDYDAVRERLDYYAAQDLNAGKSPQDVFPEITFPDIGFVSSIATEEVPAEDAAQVVVPAVSAEEAETIESSTTPAQSAESNTERADTAPDIKTILMEGEHSLVVFGHHCEMRKLAPDMGTLQWDFSDMSCNVAATHFHPAVDNIRFTTAHRVLINAAEALAGNKRTLSMTGGGTLVIYFRDDELSGVSLSVHKHTTTITKGDSTLVVHGRVILGQLDANDASQCTEMQAIDIVAALKGANAASDDADQVHAMPGAESSDQAIPAPGIDAAEEADNQKSTPPFAASKSEVIDSYTLPQPLVQAEPVPPPPPPPVIEVAHKQTDFSSRNISEKIADEERMKAILKKPWYAADNEF